MTIEKIKEIINNATQNLDIQNNVFNVINKFYDTSINNEIGKPLSFYLQEQIFDTKTKIISTRKKKISEKEIKELEDYIQFLKEAKEFAEKHDNYFYKFFERKGYRNISDSIEEEESNLEHLKNNDGLDQDQVEKIKYYKEGNLVLSLLVKEMQ